MVVQTTERRDNHPVVQSSSSLGNQVSCLPTENSNQARLLMSDDDNDESSSFHDAVGDIEEDSYEDIRRKHWKDSPFAVGLVDVTWADSRIQKKRDDDEYRSCIHHASLSAWICPLLGAGRVGNMVILKQARGKEEQDNDDEHAAPRLDCVMGPYWPVTVCLTCPIIVVLSCFAAWRVTRMHFAIIVIWVALTLSLILSLLLVSCRDPGIMKRHLRIPANNHGTTAGNEDWRWNDQAQTYRPKNAKYDPDCAVVVDGFDHTCPWTGTAIGKRNLMAFRFFVGLIFICLVFDIFLIISPFVVG